MSLGRGTGIRVDRLATGGPQQQASESEFQDQRTTTPMPILRRAVVTEVFFDPVRQLTDEVRELLDSEVANPDFVSRIKRNCILARVITGEADRLNSKPQIFFPMFDPYVSLPIKPGEQCYVMYEDPVISADPGTWLCRIPEPIDVDDVNYTHGDRRYADSDLNEDTIDRLDGASVDEPPGFPNGDPGEDSLTIGGPEEYEKIIGGSLAFQQFQPETVPRWTGRPGDMSLQGSNNTLISLMTDRTGPATNDGEVDTGRGSIYFVAGRGQDEATKPNEVENVRGDMEVDKTPGLRKVQDKPEEGDLDFNNDSAVFYMSMKTDIDRNFNIDIPLGGQATPGDASAIAMRSDRLRLMAREDIKIQAGEDGTGAAIILKADGNIILIPGDAGDILLGGDDASHAILSNIGGGAPGSRVGLPILSTMGGVTGTPDTDDPHGIFGSKVLIKTP